MIEIECVRLEQEFFDLETSWNDLLAISGNDNPFLTHQWLRSWWEAFGHNAELHLLLFREVSGGNAALVGIFPGFIRKTGLFPPLRVLRLLGSEVVDSDFLDIIIAAGNENEVYPVLWDYLRECPDFHLVELTDIPDSSPTARRVREGNAGRLGVTDWHARKRCPYIDLPSDPEGFFASLSLNTRKKYRYRRQLEARGGHLETVRERNGFSGAMEDFVRLHTGRRRQKGQAGVFATEAQRNFYATAFGRFLDAGWLDLAFLKVGDERVAAVCQFVYGDSIYYYQAGYDTAWEQSRVGFVLLCLLLDKSIREKKRCYEFLRGEERYKYSFGVTGDRLLVDLTLNSGSERGRFAVARKEAAIRLRGRIKEILPEKILETIRRFKG